jgi:uncharacterized protein (DUF1778 family)
MYDVCTDREGAFMATATAGRLNFRVPEDVERRLRSAAESTGQSLTEFVLGAAQERADEVLSTHTVVPSDYFDKLLTALDEPAKPMPALQRAARRRRQFEQR